MNNKLSMSRGGTQQSTRHVFQLNVITTILSCTILIILSFAAGTLNRTEIMGQNRAERSMSQPHGYSFHQICESMPPTLADKILDNEQLFSKNRRKANQPPTVNDLLSQTIENGWSFNRIQRSNRLKKDVSNSINPLIDIPRFIQPFIHPGLMAAYFEDPFRVAIIVENKMSAVGSMGRGSVTDIAEASIKEVLKYEFINYVAVVGIDKNHTDNIRINSDCIDNSRISDYDCSSDWLNDGRVEIFHNLFADELCEDTNEACEHSGKQSWIHADLNKINPKCNTGENDTCTAYLNDDSSNKDSDNDSEDDSEDDSNDDSEDDSEDDSNDDSEEYSEEKIIHDYTLYSEDPKYNLIFLMDAFEVLSLRIDGGATKSMDDKSLKRKKYFDTVFDALSMYGMLVMSLGSPSAPGFWRDYEIIIQFLDTYAFHAIFVYEENTCGLLKDCSFLTMIKSSSCKYGWFRNPAEYDVLIHKHRILGKQYGKSLNRVDGVSIARYQYSPKLWENHFCLKSSNPPYECGTVRNMNPKIKDFSPDMFELKTSTLGKAAGRGLFAKVAIPEGSLIMQQEASNSVHFPGTTLVALERKLYNIPEAKALKENLQNYYEGYGYSDYSTSDYEIYVDSGLSTFVNHGCRGTSNIGTLGVGYKITLDDHTSLNEKTSPSVDAEMLFKRFFESPGIYNPLLYRKVFTISGGLNYALRDIKAGEEIFTNYLLFGVARDFEESLVEVSSQCLGLSLGTISRVEVV